MIINEDTTLLIPDGGKATTMKKRIIIMIISLFTIIGCKNNLAFPLINKVAIKESPHNTKDFYNANCILMEDGGVFYSDSNTMYLCYRDKDGKEYQLSKGNYMNLMLRDDYLYALDVKNELKGSLSFVSIDLKSGRKKEFLQNTQQVYVFSDRTLFYYDDNEHAYYTASAEGTDKKIVLESESIMNMLAENDSIILYNSSNHEILLYSKEGVLSVIQDTNTEENNAQPMQCFLRDGILVIMYGLNPDDREAFLVNLLPGDTVRGKETIELQSYTRQSIVDSFFLLYDKEIQALHERIPNIPLHTFQVKNELYLVAIDDNHLEHIMVFNDVVLVK